MGRKDIVDDEFIRQRSFVQPIFDGGKIEFAITLTRSGDLEVVDMNAPHSFADLSFFNSLVSEGKFWYIPNFKEQIEKYDALFNRIAGAYKGEGEPPTETFMKEALSEIHEELVSYIKAFVYFDDPQYYDVLAIFAIHSFFKEQMPMCPLLLIEGVFGSGKSTCIHILSRVCYHPHVDGNYSPASLVDMIRKYDSTILLDEVKDNMGSERGPELNNFLKNVSARDGKYTRMRKNSQGVMESVSVSTFTDLMACTLGGFKADTKNRGIFIKTPVVNPSDCTDLDIAELFDEFDGNDPSIIVGKLYALRYLVERDKFDKVNDSDFRPTISFLPSLKKAYQLLKSGEYGVVEGILDAKPVRNRSLKVMCGYYAIARYTGTTQSVLECMLHSEKKKSEDKGVSQYGVVVAAMCKCLVFGTEEIVYQYDLEDPVVPDNFFTNAKRLKLKQITDQASSDVFNSDGRTCHVSIDRSTVGEILERLNIPIRVGGGNEKRLDPKNSGFLENFLIAVRQYAPEFEKVFATITPDSFKSASLKSEASEKVMMKSHLDGYCKGVV